VRLTGFTLLGSALFGPFAYGEEASPQMLPSTLQMTGRGAAQVLPPATSVGAARQSVQVDRTHVAIGGAQDEIYVFDVAVSVSNLRPEVEAVGVSCSVCDAYQCDTRARNAVGGENSHYLPADEGRNFSGTISVEVKKPTIWRPLGYICTLSIKLPEFDDFVPVELNADALPQAQPEPNTPFVAKLTGRLPASRPAR
jgi:hypothetical protein